jgi:hypothetical protein
MINYELLHERAFELYEHMSVQSTPGRPGEHIFTGSVTDEFRKLNVAQGEYSRLLRALKETGSVEVIQRGNAGRPSIVRLLHAPKLEEITQLTELTPAGKPGKLEQRVENVERRLPDIDLNRYIVSLGSRLDDIERRLTSIESGGNIAS